MRKLVILVVMSFGFVGSLVGRTPAEDESPAKEAIKEAITLLEARKARLEDKAAQEELAKAIAALETSLAKKVEGRGKAPPGPLNIIPEVVRKKLAGKATYNPRTGELILIYDFKDKRQLKDFDAGKSSPVLVRGALQMEGGESMTHAVKFKTLTASGVIVIGNFDGAVESPLRTTGGFGFSCGGQNGSWGRMHLLANNK